MMMMMMAIRRRKLRTDLEGVEADIGASQQKSMRQLRARVVGVSPGVAAGAAVTVTGGRAVAAGGVKRRFTGAVSRVDVALDADADVVAQQPDDVQMRRSRRHVKRRIATLEQPHHSFGLELELRN